MRKVLIVFLLGAMGLAIAVALYDDVPAGPELSTTQEKVTVWIGGSRHELEALIVRPKDTEPRPLAVISHGNPRTPQELRTTRLSDFQALAEDFAKRGYVAAVFARRGYASSTGDYGEGFGSCERPNYLGAISRTAAEYRAFITAMVERPDVDPSVIVAIGHSGGGAGVLALAYNRVPNLQAVINFSGGRGSPRNEENCGETQLVSAFGAFGSAENPPSLWLYSSADRFFWPELVSRMSDAYQASGGRVERPEIGPLPRGGDGHMLIYSASSSLWKPEIHAFLNENGLPNGIPAGN